MKVEPKLQVIQASVENSNVEISPKYTGQFKKIVWRNSHHAILVSLSHSIEGGK
jgi:hypothetical protein